MEIVEGVRFQGMDIWRERDSNRKNQEGNIDGI